MILIDTDNAMGSARGDPDDGFAIAALVRSGVAIVAISTVGGNVGEEEAWRNTERLRSMIGYEGPVLRSADARLLLHAFDGRIVALGPLTNLATARAAAEVIVVGGRWRSVGRWPPILPHEFNLTLDRAATLRLFHSGMPLTIFPLDIARKLWVHKSDLHRMGGAFGDYAQEASRRWFRYLLWARRTRRFAIYDLAAALYAIDSAGFTMETTTAVMAPNTFLRLGRGNREVKVCRDLDRERLLERFFSLVG